MPPRPVSRWRQFSSSLDASLLSPYNKCMEFLHNGTLKEIDLQHPPKVLVLGNGLNRAYEGFSWSEMIADLGYRDFSAPERRAMETLPYPLQTVIVTGDRVDVKLMEHAKTYDTDLLPEQQALFRCYTDLPWDAILTTNYTFEAEKAISSEFHSSGEEYIPYQMRTREDASEEDIYALFQYYQLPDAPPIWHIHGDLTQPDSMILGHYYYGNAISRLHHYSKSFTKKIEDSDSRYTPKSWVDYFLLGDVYIVGLGMDYSESDLWWLVNCKKIFGKGFVRLYFATDEKLKVPQERIPYIRKCLAKELLCEAYNVDYMPESLETDDYINYYRRTAADIGRELGTSPVHQGHPTASCSGDSSASPQPNEKEVTP